MTGLSPPAAPQEVRDPEPPPADGDGDRGATCGGH